MATDDLIGKVLGDYRLERKLTSGGMSHVYIGIDDKLGRRAAVKVLTPEFQDQDDMLKVRFSREAKAVAQLEHDNIITIYQYGEVDGMYFLAMRYIDGPDLSDVVKDYRARKELMPVERALAILEQVAIALDYAHARGIVHRDVKPSNVLLGHDDKAVLTDFGLVLWSDLDNTLGTAFGTPRYISPEQATDSQLAVPQSDIYSLGVMVYEIFTGHHVFVGNNAMEVALAHIHEMPTPPRVHNPRISGDAQNEILKALAKDPDDRHDTAVEFIHALKNAYNVAHDEYGLTLPFRPTVGPPTPIMSRPQIVKIDSPMTTSPTATPSESVGRSTKKILQAWDEPIAKPDIAEKMGGNRLVLWLGGVAVLAILAVAVLLIIPGLLPSTDINTTLTPDASIAGEATPVPPTATPTPVPTVAPQEAILRLNYNVDLIVLVNDGPSTLYMDQLGFRSAEETYSLTPALGAIQPGECLIVKNSAQSANVPDVWRCTEVRSTTITAGEPRFWFADSDTDQSFGIFSDSRQVGDCDTIGRLVNRMDDVSCPVEWPDFDTERQIIN
ncbi:MAG: serine/threonine protein kinase [Anaerolineae bacterium]|nr:serine/threonine protein kinase [Anaerolineae bacterium]